MEKSQKLAGIRIGNFEKALPSEAVSRKFTDHAWELVDYETTVGGGKMLAVRGGVVPPAVTISIPPRSMTRSTRAFLESVFVCSRSPLRTASAWRMSVQTQSDFS